MARVDSRIAYLFWCLSLVGINGAHRLYAGKVGSGLLYFFTFGLFGVGQFVDLCLIPDMVDKRNQRLQALSGEEPTTTTTLPTSSPMLALLQAAEANGGQLSAARAVLHTKLEPAQVERLLKEAMTLGYAEVGNDPQTGAIRYYFDV